MVWNGHGREEERGEGVERPRQRDPLQGGTGQDGEMRSEEGVGHESQRITERKASVVPYSRYVLSGLSFVLFVLEQAKGKV